MIGATSFARAIRALVLPAAAALLAFDPTAAMAQTGEAGTTGAVILELPAGSRATGLAGAFTAGSGVDALFYNPAGAGGVSAGFGAAYQSYVADVTLGSAAGAFRIGRVTLGGSILYLDAGEVDVLEPDPAFGGQRGRPTGATASAGETALRVSAATALLDEQLRIGASAGYVSSDIAGSTGNAPFVDVGMQYAVRWLTLGIGARNLGGELDYGDGAGAPLPSELRVGGAVTLPVGFMLDASAGADVITRLEGEGSAFALGGELGLRPGQAPITAAARAGYTTITGDSGLGGELHLGASVGTSGWSVDYTFQELDFFGTVHRFGVRYGR